MKDILIDTFGGQITFENRCMGCFACYSACPVKAIEMESNDEGFLYPSIDRDKCVTCGRCVSVCPSLSVPQTTNPLEILSASSKSEEMILKSSSGGIVGEIAKTIMDHQGEHRGIVFGAVFNPESQAIEHGSSDQYSVDSILRSKYVQSAVNGAYCEALDALIEHRKVVFVGTPCQIHGLRNLIDTQDQNLFLVDFKCHGVPSPGFFRKVVKALELKNKSKLCNVTFREKDFGWRDQCIKFYFENGKVERYRSRYFYYYQLFINNYSLRRSCFACDYYKRHASDITLADHWQNGEKTIQGRSLIFVNTPKGKSLLRSLERRIDVHSRIDMNLEYYQHRYPWRNRDRFFGDYIYMDDSSLIRKYKYVGVKDQCRRALARFMRLFGKPRGKSAMGPNGGR
jgi:coenzyme F420-reducing hydrogenase beta subunit